MRRHFGALVLIAVSVCPPGVAAFGFNDKERERAASLARSFVERQANGDHAQTPGLSIAISRNGRVVFAHGFGEALPSIPATEETIYQIGSLTKQFTAAAVLRLIESRVQVGTGEPLSLSTPVSSLLAGAEAWSTQAGPELTVQHLLTMTCNLPNFTRTPPESTDPWGSIPAPRLLSALTQVKPAEAPGSFGYSNTSYFLLAELIESPRLSGPSRSYRDALRALWREVGLQATGFQDDSAIGKQLAGPNYKRRPAFLYGDWLKGSADVSSTVLDLQAWNRALIEGRVLSNSMLDLMFSESARVDVYTWYGMGWFVREKDGIRYYSHSGSLPGYTAFNLIARKGVEDWSSVTILTNSYGVEGLEDAAQELADLALAD